MNRIKGKEKSCKSENRDFLGEPKTNSNNRHFIRHISGPPDGPGNDRPF